MGGREGEEWGVSAEAVVERLTPFGEIPPVDVSGTPWQHTRPFVPRLSTHPGRDVQH